MLRMTANPDKSCPCFLRLAIEMVQERFESEKEDVKDGCGCVLRGTPNENEANQIWMNGRRYWGGQNTKLTTLFTFPPTAKNALSSSFHPRAVE